MYEFVGTYHTTYSWALIQISLRNTYSLAILILKSSSNGQKKSVNLRNFHPFLLPDRAPEGWQCCFCSSILSLPPSFSLSYSAPRQSAVGKEVMSQSSFYLRVWYLHLYLYIVKVLTCSTILDGGEGVSSQAWANESPTVQPAIMVFTSLSVLSCLCLTPK